MKNKESLGYDHPLPTAIRKSIAAKGITQAALAAAVDLQPGTISNYCNGERTPDAIALAKIAKTLNVSADYLLGIEKINVPENRSDQPEQFTIKTCGDAVRMLEALLNEIKGCKFHFIAEEWVEQYNPEYDVTRSACIQEKAISFDFPVPGIVKYFEGVQKMNEIQIQLPEVFETIREPMRIGLLNTADGIKIEKKAHGGGFIEINDEDLPF